MPVRFGSFRLDPEQRVLREGERPVRLGARAFDVLTVLVAHAGALVTNEELLRTVWTDTTVDDRSLRVHVAALRKVLGAGDRYIVNVPGRGYSFVAPVTHEDAEGASAPTGAHTLPPRLTRTIGRDAFIGRVERDVVESHLVSVVGPAGVGKTTVAVAIAERLLDAFPAGVCFVDLAPLVNPALLAGQVASQLGLGLYSEDPLPGLLAFLRARRVLLVLDNCERLVGAVAKLAERILATAPDVHLLVTSREPLGAAGEWVRRLAPLERDAAEELFRERAHANTAELELTPENTTIIATLCVQLEGLPLAIELAAGRLDEVGLQGLTRGIADRFTLLGGGRRTGAPRHRTLRDTLDWSCTLLPEEEQSVLARVSVFAGSFSRETALVVAARDETDRRRLPEVLASLVSKSLVTVELGGDIEHYRLFDMTRDYVREKLTPAQAAALSRNAAEAYLRLLGEADTRWTQLTSRAWIGLYGPILPDVRAAIEWAFSPEGDSALAIALAIAGQLLWTQLAQMSEYRDIVERALARNALLDRADLRSEARLAGTLGNLLFHTKGPAGDEETGAAFARSLRAAIVSGDRHSELFALSGACALAVTHGDYPAGLACAERFDESIGPAGKVARDRALAHVLHYLGDFDRAGIHLDRAALVFADSKRIRSSGVAYDHQVTIQSIQARMYWLRGRTCDALALARSCVEYARSLEHGISLCLTLVTSACPIAFVVGGRAAAEPYLELLHDTATKHSMIRAMRYAEVYDVAMRTRAERSASGLAARMTELVHGPIDGPQLENIAVLGDAYVDDRIVDRATAGSGGWCAAEMLRLHGERVLGDDPARAEDLFRQSIALARKQGTRAWEIRAATSLARVLRDTERRDEARAVLDPLRASLKEASVDVQHANALLETL